VKAITEALCGLEVSRSQVSALTKRLDEEVEAWHDRRLEKAYPYLVADARSEGFLKGRLGMGRGV